ncbi:LacI family DNA-binding transcriptional regulator [Companilactobacillus heilongjiangensis]|uniref:LacI family transcriptional regulator n=1 Tax=Companilactobacillus heilongjiangensis TaxID=1074467 RepID=A0A0K2LB40_9LACO|nr:LacI family DNA-binding transcriptional regulator [Companilactobacillus heilongjiangensis]ALB28511.1 LacI family transcriptional regulator [Companilactobacillus heilongjiangensis]
MNKKYSIKDIAKLSGVSVATVSRVINDNGRFSEETRKKVQKVIRDTDYHTNFSAKNLRMNKSFSVGILVPDISNYFFANVVQKIEKILFKQGYSTIICNTARDEKKELAYLKMLESKGIDGLIVISGAKAFDISKLKTPQKIPFVCIDREPKDKQNTVFISSDHYQGAVEATNSLFEAGCKFPIIASHSRTSSSSSYRLRGFKDALAKNNITYNKSKNHIVLDSDNITKKLNQFLELEPQIDGIFAINDSIAINVLSALLKIGKSVPKDIKIIGFDNDPQDIHSYPTLSSIKQDTDKIAQVTVDNLINLINHTGITGESITIPVSLIQRESSK